MEHSLKKNEIHRNKAKKKKPGRHVHTHECTYERTIIICYVIQIHYDMTGVFDKILNISSLDVNIL